MLQLDGQRLLRLLWSFAVRPPKPARPVHADDYVPADEWCRTHSTTGKRVSA